VTYPERIVPEETSPGILALHLKRYEFALPWSESADVLDAGCAGCLQRRCVAVRSQPRYEIFIHASVGWPEESEFFTLIPSEPESDERSSVSRFFVEPFLKVLPQLCRNRSFQSYYPDCGGFIDSCGYFCASVVSH